VVIARYHRDDQEAGRHHREPVAVQPPCDPNLSSRAIARTHPGTRRHEVASSGRYGNGGGRQDEISARICGVGWCCRSRRVRAGTRVPAYRPEGSSQPAVWSGRQTSPSSDRSPRKPLPRHAIGKVRDLGCGSDRLAPHLDLVARRSGILRRRCDHAEGGPPRPGEQDPHAQNHRWPRHRAGCGGRPAATISRRACVPKHHPDQLPRSLRWASLVINTR